MRFTAAAQRKVPFRSNVQTTSIPAPTGGWDAISALADMPPDRAVQLDNWIPRVGYVEPRRGYISWATGMGSSTPVETIMPYYAGSTANDKLFAIAGTTIYDATLTGAAVATTVVGLSVARCEWTNFTNASNLHYQIVCNGVDTPKIYDGSTWADTAITGVTQSNLVQPFVYNGRLWFVQVNSLVPVYLALGAISGAATTFPIGSYASKGGYLQRIASWSVDTRQTVNDYLAFITSRGQVVVFVGTDPASATDWQLVGVYDIGRPLGRRCTLKLVGDLAVITVDGISSMNEALIADRATGIRKSISERILGAINTATSLYANNFGWQLTNYSPLSLAILNVPITTNSTSQQFVMNELTGAWCRFVNINANTWEIFNDNIYFGGNTGVLYRWDIGSSDNGSDINCTAKSAFNYFGSRGYSKRFTMLRPVLTTDGTVVPGTGINVDFGQNGAISTPNVATGLGPLWDQAVWDTAVWPYENTNQADWITVGGIGHCASVITTCATNASGSDMGVTLQLNAWDLMFERGSPL